MIWHTLGSNLAYFKSCYKIWSTVDTKTLHAQLIPAQRSACLHSCTVHLWSLTCLCEWTQNIRCDVQQQLKQLKQLTLFWTRSPTQFLHTKCTCIPIQQPPSDGNIYKYMSHATFPTSLFYLGLGGPMTYGLILVRASIYACAQPFMFAPTWRSDIYTELKWRGKVTNRVPRALSTRQNSHNVRLITFLHPMSGCMETYYLPSPLQFHDRMLTWAQANFTFLLINPNFEIMYINNTVGL